MSFSAVARKKRSMGLFWLRLWAVLSAGFCIQSIALSAELSSSEKLPIPSSVKQAEMIRLVNEAYKLDEAKTAAAKVNLGKELAFLASNSNKPEEQFVLLRRAAELAKDAGHLPLMCQSIEAIGSSFEMDTLMVQAKMFDQFVNAATDPVAISMGRDGAKELINRALEEDRYDVAASVIQSANRLVSHISKPRDREEFKQLQTEVERLREQWQQVCEAQKRLKTDTKDPKANFIVGRWELLQKKDIPSGLAHLAKGNDSSYRHLAQQELTTETTKTDSLADLADAWWEFAQSQTDESIEPLSRHAGELYKTALPKLPEGLRKMLVERRLEKLALMKRSVSETIGQESDKTPNQTMKPSVPLPLGQPLELLPLVDIKRDSVLGFWEQKGDSLVTTLPRKNSTLLLPVIAEGDYRLETQFTRTTGDDTVAIIVPVGGHPCLIALSESSGKASRLGVDGKSSRANKEIKTSVEPGTLTNRQKHAMSILVRLRGETAFIEVILDGETLFDWSGDKKSVSTNGWPSQPAKQFALGTNESVSFHSIRLRPISGKAMLLAPAAKEESPVATGTSRSAMSKGKNRS